MTTDDFRTAQLNAAQVTCVMNTIDTFLAEHNEHLHDPDGVRTLLAAGKRIVVHRATRGEHFTGRLLCGHTPTSNPRAARITLSHGGLNDEATTQLVLARICDALAALPAQSAA